jgi:BclB C-terminal domain-containing protein
MDFFPELGVGAMWAILLLLFLAVIVLSVFVAIAYERSSKCGGRGHRGFNGTTGFTGPAGVAGTATNTGATGPMGATGTAGSGAILGFASNEPVTLTTIIDGTADFGALIADGSSVSAVDVSGATISLIGAPAQALNEAFDAPRAGTITAISANYSNVSALVLGAGTADVTVQLWHAAAGTTTFAPLAGVTATIPLTGTLVLGTAGSDLVTGLSVAVVAGDRYLLVASVTTSGVAVAISLNGYVSAGLAIT